MVSASAVSPVARTRWASNSAFTSCAASLRPPTRTTSRTRFYVILFRILHSLIELRSILGTNYTVGDIAVPGDACVWWTQWYGVNTSHPAAQAYYNSVFSQYASWGVDFLKVDCMLPSSCLEASSLKYCPARADALRYIWRERTRRRHVRRAPFDEMLICRELRCSVR
jgi:hypothetical protein